MPLAFLRNDHVDARRAVFDQRRSARPSQVVGWMEWSRRRYRASKRFSHLCNWQIGHLSFHELVHEGLQRGDAMFDRALPLLQERQRQLGDLLLKGV
jgi:hypothetical protein